MTVFFRVDAAPDIGSGHFMRCLALAGALSDRGVRAIFICREVNENFKRLADKNRCAIFIIRNDSEDLLGLLKKEGDDTAWVVIDHYGLDIKWETTIRPFADKMMVIDDQGQREHLCDILLDQNIFEDLEYHYEKLVPAGCKKLLGPEYALLRREFTEARIKAVPRDGTVRRILVFFGTGDLENVTRKILDGIVLLNRQDITVDVIIGIDNPHRAELEAFTAGSGRVKCHYNADNIAGLMLNSDLYIGSAGVTTWERCCLGLPSLVITAAENQQKIIQYMAAKGLLGFLGESSRISPKDIKDRTGYYLSHPEILNGYSRLSMELVDGMGAQRCADAMMLS